MAVGKPVNPHYAMLLGNADFFIFLSREDIDWARRWKWQIKYDKHKRKVYAVRTGWVLRRRRRVRTSIFLHVEICRRANGPPTRRRRIADHKDGESRNCTRSNLWWRTASENRRNIGGVAAWK